MNKGDRVWIIDMAKLAVVAVVVEDVGPRTVGMLSNGTNANSVFYSRQLVLSPYVPEKCIFLTERSAVQALHGILVDAAKQAQARLDKMLEMTITLTHKEQEYLIGLLCRLQAARASREPDLPSEIYSILTKLRVNGDE